MNRTKLLAIAMAGALALSACGAAGQEPESGPTSLSTTANQAEYASFRDAIAANDAAAVDEYLAAGESLEQDLGAGYSPLHVAALTNSANVAQRLIEAGAAIDATAPGGVTPLMLASESGEAETVIALLNAGADPYAQDSSGPGAGPMHYAARADNIAALQAYLDHGLDVDTLATYSTPLIFAAYSGATDACLLLLDNGADIHATDRAGADAIENAENGGFPELAEILRTYNASGDQ